MAATAAIFISGVYMSQPSEQLLEKIRKDFNTICEKNLMSVDETDWLPYKAGYLDCLRRFGGNCIKSHKRTSGRGYR